MEAEVLNLAEIPETFQEVRHGFEVAGNHLLVPRELYSELVNRPRICRIPTTPDWFRGFMNHRGETVPVYNLSLLFGDEHASEKDPRWVLLLDQQPYMAGILLNNPPAALVAPTSLDDDSISLFNDYLQPHTGSYVECDGKVWAELQHRQFFSSLKEKFKL